MKNSLRFLLLASFIHACSGSSSKKTPDSPDVPVADSDQTLVNKAAGQLTETALLAQNTSKTAVTSQLNMAATADGVSIAWTSSQPTIISERGIVQRPAASACPKGAVDVHLSALLSKAAAKATKEFDVAVLCLPKTDKEAIESAQKALTAELILGANKSLAEVRLPLNLLKEGAEGTTISWTSSNPVVIDNEGRVTPDFTHVQDVILTASVTKNKEAGQATFAVTVPPQFESATARLQADRAWLLERNILNGNAAQVISDLLLPTSGLYGSQIIWESSDETVLRPDGKVKRPAALSPDVAVTLTAHLELPDATVPDISFALTVKATEASDEERVDADLLQFTAESIRGGNTSLDAVTQNLQLTNTSMFGSQIVWTSKVGEIISNSGYVARPAWNMAPAKVELTVKATSGNVDRTKTFIATVLPAQQTDAEAVEQDMATAVARYLGQNPSAQEIRKPLNLPQQGAYGSKLSWTADPSDRIAASGAVTLPAWKENPVAVKLTLEASKGQETRKKIFDLSLHPLLKSDQEKAELDFAWLVNPEQEKAWLAKNPNKSQITSALNLPRLAPLADSTITWDTNSNPHMDASGAVRRPKPWADDAKVTLRFSLKSGTVEKTGEYQLTVLAEEVTDELAVDADISALTGTLIKGEGNANLRQIVSKMNLVADGLNRTKITWASEPAGVVEANGTVNRPEWKEGDPSIEILLTATIERGEVKKTKLFPISVLRQPASDEQAVGADLNTVTFERILQSNPDNLHIRNPLTLFKEGDNGSTLTWTSSDPAIQPTGVVIQPPFNTPSIPVVLTVTAIKGQEKRSKTLDVVVLAKDPTDAKQLLQADKDNLTLASILNGQSPDQVTKDLNLPAFGTYKSAYKWSISEADVIDPSGHVKRPTWDSKSKTVILRVTISHSLVAQKESVEFPAITVLREEGDPKNKIEADLVWLSDARVQGKNTALDKITQSLELPTLGDNDSQISWSIPEGGLVKPSGTVQQPRYDLPAVTLTLQANLKLKGEERSKSFTITILPAEATDDEAEQATLQWLEEKQILGQNKSLSAVTTDLKLITAGLYGAEIEWESSAVDVLDNTGRVRRPKIEAGDKSILLYAYIYRDAIAEEKVFKVKVLAQLPNLVFKDGQTDVSLQEPLVLEPGQNLTLTVLPNKGDILAYKIGCEGPAGTSFTGTQLSFKNVAVGSYSVVCTISRNGASQDLTFQLIVNAKPSISCSVADSYQAGTEARIPCTVSDAENDKVKLSVAASDCSNASVDADNVLHVPLSFHNCNVQLAVQDAARTFQKKILIPTDPSSMRFEVLNAKNARGIGGSTSGMAIANGKIYVTSDRGLWQSSDQGETWSVTQPTAENKLGSADASSIQIQGRNIAMWSSDYLSWSTDEGQTWQTRTFQIGQVGPLQSIKKVILAENTIFAQYSDDRYKQVNWMKHDLTNPQGSWDLMEKQFSSLSYQEGVLLGWDANGQLSRSLDEGKVWQDVQKTVRTQVVHLDKDHNLLIADNGWKLWTCTLENCTPQEIEGHNLKDYVLTFTEMNGFVFAQTNSTLYYADKNNLRQWYKSSVYANFSSCAIGDGMLVAKKYYDILLGTPGELQKTVATLADPASMTIRTILAFGGRTWMATSKGLFWSTDKGQTWTESKEFVNQDVSLKVEKNRLLIRAMSRGMALDEKLNTMADTNTFPSPYSNFIKSIATDGVRVYVGFSEDNGPAQIHFTEGASWKKGLISRNSDYSFYGDELVTLDNVVYMVATKTPDLSGSYGYLLRADSLEGSNPVAINTSTIFPATTQWSHGVVSQIFTIPDGRSWVVSRNDEWLERSAKGVYKNLGSKHASARHAVVDGNEAFALEFKVRKPKNGENKMNGQLYKLGYDANDPSVESYQQFDLGTLGLDPAMFDATGYFPKQVDEDYGRELVNKLAVGHRGLYVATERGLTVSQDKDFKTWNVFGVEHGLSCPNVKAVWAVEDQLFVDACGLHRVRKP